MCSLSFVFWFFRWTGADAYIIPLTIIIIIFLFEIKNKEFSSTINNLFIYDGFEKKYKYMLFALLLNSVLLLCIGYSKYNSFEYNVLDLGNFSNILDNFFAGKLHMSYLKKHPFGDHFVPTLLMFTIFYYVKQTSFWLIIIKFISFSIFPLLLYIFGLTVGLPKRLSINLSFILGCAWLFFYRPAINFLYFEFNPSNLSSSFIIISFIFYYKRKWKYFYISLILMLGLKEHLSTVCLGLGICGILTNKYHKVNFSLIIIGSLSLYIIPYIIMSHFNYGGYQHEGLINPIKDIDLKLKYITYVYGFFLFIPLIFPKYGIISIPSIGINLVSGKQSMYTGCCQYGDVVAPLIFISIILIASDRSNIKQMRNILAYKVVHVSIIIWIIIFSIQLPENHLIKLIRFIPNAEHRNAAKEIHDFQLLDSKSSLALYDNIGPYFNRLNVELLQPPCNTKLDSDYAIVPIFSTRSLFGVQNKQCIDNLDRNESYERETQYVNIAIYKKL